jgi:hypothetical protein
MKRPKTFQCALLAAAFTLYLAGSVVGMWGSIVGLAVLVGLRKNLHPLIWVAPFLLIGIAALPSGIVTVANVNMQTAMGHDVIVAAGKLATALSLQRDSKDVNATARANLAIHSYDQVMLVTMPLMQVLVLVGTAPVAFICSLFIWTRLKKHVFALIPELNVP